MIGPLTPQGGRLEVLLGGRRLMLAWCRLKERKPAVPQPHLLPSSQSHQPITSISPNLCPPNAGFSRRRATQ